MPAGASTESEPVETPATPPAPWKVVRRRDFQVRQVGRHGDKREALSDALAGDLTARRVNGCDHAGGLGCAVAPGANIILMHAYGVPFEGKIRAARDIEEILEPFLAAARKKVFENLHELSDAAGLAPHDARLLACHGTPLHQILEQEHNRHCDLIVMGRHGEASLLERLFLGSVTKQVLAMSHADVLVSAAE